MPFQEGSMEDEAEVWVMKFPFTAPRCWDPSAKEDEDDIRDITFESEEGVKSYLDTIKAGYKFYNLNEQPGGF